VTKTRGEPKWINVEPGLMKINHKFRGNGNGEIIKFSWEAGLTKKMIDAVGAGLMEKSY